MKEYTLKLILIWALCFLNLGLYSQEKTPTDYQLVVTLHNAPFTTLTLIDYNDKVNTFIKGKAIGQSKWKFNIPDSIVYHSEYMMLVVPEKDTIANAYHQIRFFRNFDRTNNSLVNIGVQDKLNYIEAEYKGQTRYEKENVSRFSNTTDSIIVGSLISNDFNLVSSDENSDIMLRSLAPNFAWFLNPNGKAPLSYDEHLQNYISLAERFPNSRYLITYLALNLYQFKAREDVKSIYENFSNLTKSLKWSKAIERYLSGNFVNSSLINLEKKRYESLVEDETKYTLVTFSASWCTPCIEEIPLLRELYKDLKPEINFSYVSIDRQKDLKAFQDLLNKHQTPWRTLYAYNDLERIRDLYFVATLPHSLLIYPGGKMEVVDVRNKEVQKKLYLLKEQGG